MRAVLLRNGDYGEKQVRLFGESLESAGIEVIDGMNGLKEPPENYGIGVVFGQWLGNKPRNLIVIETGYFLRDPVIGKDATYSVNYGAMLDTPGHATIEGLKRLAGMLHRHDDKMPGFETQKNISDSILVLGQVPKDKSHPFEEHGQLIDWLRGYVPKNSKVVFRHHPLFPSGELPGDWVAESPGTLEESLAFHRPRLIVCYSSTAGLWAKCDGFKVHSSVNAWYSKHDMITAGIIAAQSTFRDDELRSGAALEFIVGHCKRKHGVQLLNHSRSGLLPAVGK